MAARGALRDHALEPPRFAPSDVAVWCSGALLAAPVLALRYPPMGDLPFHESLVALLRHFGDPAWSPPGLYRLNLGQPNQAFHLVAWALSLVAPTADPRAYYGQRAAFVVAVAGDPSAPPFPGSDAGAYDGTGLHILVLPTTITGQTP